MARTPVPTRIDVDCCIAGAGPAGVMLGMLLARAGLKVVVLEKHADFFRDFRGDTIHPSTIQVLGELGLRDAFLALPHTDVHTLDAVINGFRLRPVDFGYLRKPYDVLALMPQWDFLAFLAEHASAYPGFRLLMSTEATGLTREGGVVVGATASGPQGDVDIRARLTVAADGRGSTLRKASGLRPHEFGVPIDVLWFRLPKPAVEPPDTLAYLDESSMVLTIPRGDYYQMGMVIPKGGFEPLKANGLPGFRASLVATVPFLAEVVGSLTSWNDVKLLTVQIDRLSRWFTPGLLCIGDAAHAMSPAFGVGVNYAVQDAVAAANLLAEPLRSGASTEQLEDACLRLQRRRLLAVERMQRIQLAAHRVIAKPGGGAILPDPVPASTRLMLRAAAPIMQRVTARLVGRGFRPEHVSPGIRGATTRGVLAQRAN
ncbi:MAG TPA: FAD-dependent oxidoreductase [Humibacter sp.]|nr:FAD-dependent oxidoreductase [Humibacter sp.]